MAGVPAPKVARSSRNYTPAQVLSSLIFWILCVMFVIGVRQRPDGNGANRSYRKGLRRREHNHFFRCYNPDRRTDHR